MSVKIYIITLRYHNNQQLCHHTECEYNIHWKEAQAPLYSVILGSKYYEYYKISVLRSLVVETHGSVTWRKVPNDKTMVPRIYSRKSRVNPFPDISPQCAEAPLSWSHKSYIISRSTSSISASRTVSTKLLTSPITQAVRQGLTIMSRTIPAR
jgi:hypothetical protein